MEGIFNTLALGLRHEIEVDGLTSDDDAERTVFHDCHTVTKLRDGKISVSGEGVVATSWCFGVLGGWLVGGDWLVGHLSGLLGG